MKLPRTSASGARRALRPGGLAVALAAGFAAPVHADTDFEARYTVRLSILPITFATANVKASVPERGRYTVNFNAKGPSFSMNGRSTGLVQANMVWPISAAIKSADSSESREITLAMSRGRVRRETVEPPMPYRPDRVPLTPEHRKGVVDPVSALLMPVISKGGAAEAGNCDRTLPVFEGTERFDIRLSYLRTEIVKTAKGYEGPAVVCRASYKAIAGHRAKGSAQYMEQNRTIEAWLAPIGESNMLAPWRVSFSTKVGTLILEAVEFTASTPTKQADAGARSPASESGTAR